MTDKPNLTLIEGAKPDPKDKLGTVSAFGDGIWALRCVLLMVISMPLALLGLGLAAWKESFWPLLLAAPFVAGLVALLVIMMILVVTELWSEAWGPR